MRTGKIKIIAFQGETDFAGRKSTAGRGAKKSKKRGKSKKKGAGSGLAPRAVVTQFTYRFLLGAKNHPLSHGS